MKIRDLALMSAFALGVPSAALEARDQFGTSGIQYPAYREGYERGIRAGEEDGRRNESFEYTDESDYRRADQGYRSQYGTRDRYRDEFRRGYAEGYRIGYSRYNTRYDDRYEDRANPRGRGMPPWANGRGRGNAPYGNAPYGDYGRYDRNDLAFTSGYNDGYEAGLDDGRDRRRNDPIAEGRYRSADHGYQREYGSRDAYKIRYREAFKQGYQRGYDDGRRYGGRSWWPF